MMRRYPNRANVSNVAMTALAASILISALLLSQPRQDVIQYVYLSSFHYSVTARIQRAGTDQWIPIMLNHLNVLTTIGKNWIELELGDTGDTNEANYISLSESATSPTAAWTQLPSELAADNLSRAQGVYTSTGDGAWTIKYTFTCDVNPHTIRCTGLQWLSTGDNNLLAAVAFGTPASLADGDKLEVTWTCSVAEA